MALTNLHADQKVEVDSQGVTRFLPDGKTEKISWERLIGFDIMTTSDGPFAEDVFFVLMGEDKSGCMVPQYLADDLIDRLFKLPNIDAEAYMQSMFSVYDNTFVCWRRPLGMTGKEVRDAINRKEN